MTFFFFAKKRIIDTWNVSNMVVCKNLATHGSDINYLILYIKNVDKTTFQV